MHTLSYSPPVGQSSTTYSKLGNSNSFISNTIGPWTGLLAMFSDWTTQQKQAEMLHSYVWTQIDTTRTALLLHYLLPVILILTLTVLYLKLRPRVTTLPSSSDCSVTWLSCEAIPLPSPVTWCLLPNCLYADWMSISYWCIHCLHTVCHTKKLLHDGYCSCSIVGLGSVHVGLAKDSYVTL